MTSKVFYDSYAIIAFLFGCEKYRQVFKQNRGVTSYVQIMEVYYAILKEHSKKQAEIVLKELSTLLVEPEIEDISQAMQFRYKNKKKKFSYADALGYSMAQRMKIPFVTGDKSFKDVRGVEFIKATK